MNELYLKASTISAYLHSFVATDLFNQQAKQMSSQFDQVMVGIQKVGVLLEAWVGQFKDILPEVLDLGGVLVNTPSRLRKSLNKANT